MLLTFSAGPIPVTPLASGFERGVRITYSRATDSSGHFLGFAPRDQRYGDRFFFTDRPFRGRLETVDGERWTCRLHGPMPGMNSEALLTIGARFPLPPATQAGVYHSRKYSWGPIEKTTLEKAAELGLKSSPRSHLVRWDGRWWHPTASLGIERVLLGRSYADSRRDAYAVIAPHPDAPKGERPVEISLFTPIELDFGLPMRSFAYKGSEWVSVWEGARYSIISCLDPKIRGTDLRKWQAITKNPKNGWQVLYRGPPLQTHYRGLVENRKRSWTIGDPHPTSYLHPSGQRYDGQRYHVRFDGGKWVAFILPDPASPSYRARLHGRSHPNINFWAGLYARLPRRVLDDCVDTIEIHTHQHRTEEGLISANYHRETRTIRHFSFTDDPETLFDTAIHEAVGHGRFTWTVPFRALWLSAMLASGIRVRPDRRELCEDLAHSCEMYRRHVLLGGPSDPRFALLDQLLPEDGASVDAAAIDRLLGCFFVHSDRLVMGKSAQPAST